MVVAVTEPSGSCALFASRSSPYFCANVYKEIQLSEDVVQRRSQGVYDPLVEGFVMVRECGVLSWQLYMSKETPDEADICLGIQAALTQPFGKLFFGECAITSRNEERTLGCGT